MPDKVDHRGLTAYQSVYNNGVCITKDGRVVKHIAADKRQTVDDLKRLIDEFIAEGGE